jgi:hypothetical protein
MSTFQVEEGKLQNIQEMLLSAEDDLTRQLQAKSERSNKKAVNA